MQKLVALFSAVIIIYGCKEKDTQIDIKESVRFIGAKFFYTEDLVKDKSWILDSVEHGFLEKITGESAKQKWHKISDQVYYLTFEKCKDVICSITYTINEDDYSSIMPSQLRKIGFALLDTINNEEVRIVDYIKEPVVVRLLMDKKTQGEPYTVYIYSADLKQ